MYLTKLKAQVPPPAPRPHAIAVVLEVELAIMASLICRPSGVVLAVWLLHLGVLAQQSQGIPSAINTGTGLVYVIIIILFALNIATPIIRCLWVRYIKDFLEWIVEKAKELRVRIRDRMTTATALRREQLRSRMTTLES